MKIDLTMILMTVSGEPLKEGKNDISLRKALMATLLGCEEKSGEQKYKNWRMAMRIQDNDNLDFSAKEITQLKEACSYLSTPVMGRIWDVLDPQGGLEG